ncbi:MAG TPA: hypothetical protein DCL64_04125 [Ruminococcaceae bacterium]|jgi:oligosaccharide repeat unit polymerase|nr:hypothetical protein [Oscillospiraceae bacterium]
MTAEHLGTGNSLRNTVLFGAFAVLMLVANLLAALGGAYQETAVCVMFAANAALNVAVLADVFANIRRDFPLLVFTASFDLLLLGRVYVSFFGDYEHILYRLEARDFGTLFDALQIVTLAFFFVYAAYKLSAPLFVRREAALREKRSGAVRRNALLPVIRQICVAVLLVSSLAFFYTLFRSILYVFRHGYLGSYIQQAEDDVPSAISRLSTLFAPAFAAFLATMPSRRQMKLPLAVYGVYMLASLFTGKRNTFVCEVLMLVIYFVLRDGLRARENRLFRKRTVLWAVFGAVALMYVLELVAEIRAGHGVRARGVFDSLVSFVYSQGASFRVIIQTVNNWDLFDHSQAYRFLFYPFEQFAHNNIFIRTMFGLNPIVEVQNTEFVQTTSNFAHVLTYMVDPGRYLSGGGFGTSFVAEAFVAYGMAGVAAVSALVGVAFRFFSSLLTRHWVVIALGLIALKDFIYLPRNFAFLWVTNTFNFTYLCFFAGVYLLALLFVRLGAHVRRAPGGFAARPAAEEKT